MSQSQLNMFAPPPASRSTDPVTSHAAEAQVNRNGSRRSQIERVVKLVGLFPGRTCQELAQLAPRADVQITERQLSRRLSDAHAENRIIAGQPRKCSISGAHARPWTVADIERNGTGAAA